MADEGRLPRHRLQARSGPYLFPPALYGTSFSTSFLFAPLGPLPAFAMRLHTRSLLLSHRMILLVASPVSSCSFPLLSTFESKSLSSDLLRRFLRPIRLSFASTLPLHPSPLRCTTKLPRLYPIQPLRFVMSPSTPSSMTPSNSSPMACERISNIASKTWLHPIRLKTSPLTAN